MMMVYGPDVYDLDLQQGPGSTLEFNKHSCTGISL